jgi:hypothetical protein
MKIQHVIFGYDAYSFEQYVALISVLVILLNQHGNVLKLQADAKLSNKSVLSG